MQGFKKKEKKRKNELDYRACLGKKRRKEKKRIIKRRDGFSVEAVLIEKSIRGEAERIRG